jgi:hypothetical protein
MIRVVQCKICPVCNGTRVRDDPRVLPAARRELACNNCQGEGVVPLLTCRGCGRAAMHWDARVPYCGRKECWGRLVEEIDLAKVRATPNYGPFPMRGGMSHIRNWQGRYWDPFKREFQDYPPSMMQAERLTPQELEDFTNACEGYCG